MIYNKQKTNYIMSVLATDASTTETTDKYYNNILKKRRYYVTSDIHGDVILFIRFLVGVYNDLNGTVKYFVGPPKTVVNPSNLPIAFNYYNIPNLDYSSRSVKYEIKNIFCINDETVQRSVEYDTFIESLNDLLTAKNTCIVLNGDIFDNHLPHNEKNNNFEWLKDFNKNDNLISLSSDSTINIYNKESISKIIEISIIYDIIVLLNKKGNLLFLVGNHELNMLKYYNDVSSITGSKRQRECDSQDILRTNKQARFGLLQRRGGGGVNDEHCILRLLYEFIKQYGYIELDKPNKLHIQHAINNIRLSNNKVDFYLNNLDFLKNKLTWVYSYNRLCQQTNSYYIYGHASNIHLLRCEYNNKPTGNKYYFIDRQYSIHEIIKNINFKYNLISCYDVTRKYNIDKCIAIPDLFETLKKLKSLKDEPEIIIKLYCLIYHDFIKYKNIIITDNSGNQINNKSFDKSDKTSIILHINEIYTKLMLKQCIIYYNCSNNKNLNYNKYDALTYSLCHRFENMFGITNLESEYTITNPTNNCNQFQYELCDYIDLKAACYEESESLYRVRTITY